MTQAPPAFSEVPTKSPQPARGKAGHMQQIVNAAHTPGEGARVQGDDLRPGQRGLAGGYLANPRLAKVHWQAGDRALPAPQVTVAGESVLWVDPAEIPPMTTSAGLAGRWPRGGTGSGHGLKLDRQAGPSSSLPLPRAMTRSARFVAAPR